MHLDFIAGFLFGFCIVQSISMWKKNRVLSIIELVLTIVSPVCLKILLSTKASSVFGGTDFEYLIQTVRVDGRYDAYLAVALYIALIIIAIYNLIKYRK